MQAHTFFDNNSSLYEVQVTGTAKEWRDIFIDLDYARQDDVEEPATRRLLELLEERGLSA